MMNTNYSRTTTNNGGEATGPRAKADQVIFEALCKACEMIVASRGEQQHQQQAPQVSSRFNLTLPEHASVRQILQKWRRALHLPLRLDVYYQHPNETTTTETPAADAPQRELLERWCLVYAPPSSEEWIQYQQQQQRMGYNKTTTQAVTLDPIVQLRQVCKKIVVWLRTLYCMARLLPATSFLHSKNPNIGFSLYAISEGTDDDVQLQQQGFLCHPSGGMQPSYVVGTPYGVLTWKVLTAEASVIHRLTGRGQAKQAWHFPTTTTTSRAIPIQPRDDKNSNHPSIAEEVEDDDEDYHYFQQQQQYSQELRSQGSSNNHGGIPQSAPAHLMASPWQTQQQTKQGPTQQFHPNMPPNTYQQPSQFRDRITRAPNQQLHRRHTDVGPDGMAREPSSQVNAPTHPPAAAPTSGEAKRVLSGLSLAMMTLEDKNNHDTSADQTISTATPAGDSKEKRRAALHQAPPHQRSPQDDTAATTPPTLQQHSQPYFAHAPHTNLQHRDTSQEYGYAYNNHIPWQKIHPSTTNPSIQRESEDSPGQATPSVLGSTPPPMLLNPGSHNSNPSSFGKQFLPPRSGSTGAPLTPPFPNRPTGFAVHSDPPSAHLPLLGTGAVPASPLQERPVAHLADDAMPQRLTSLDLLHQSPFLWNPNPHGSMLSSLTMPDSSTMLDLKRSLLLTHQQPTDFFASDGDWADEMPFAVEETAPSAVAAAPTLEDLSSLGASAAVASLAQKCATSQRLQLFESRMSEGGAVHDVLASQLADFRAFGASLTETPSSSSSVVTNTTPTALRT
mmetsp:Transcript_6463/g.12934  ORF Transcript_6463/g.12934 Transcript_6463/m.12934 type:complete len:786 (-) Transcript_6463:150-2507(-)